MKPKSSKLSVIETITNIVYITLMFIVFFNTFSKTSEQNILKEGINDLRSQRIFINSSETDSILVNNLDEILLNYVVELDSLYHKNNSKLNKQIDTISKLDSLHCNLNNLHFRFIEYRTLWSNLLSWIVGIFAIVITILLYYVTREHKKIERRSNELVESYKNLLNENFDKKSDQNKKTILYQTQLIMHSNFTLIKNELNNRRFKHSLKLLINSYRPIINIVQIYPEVSEILNDFMILIDGIYFEMTKDFDATTLELLELNEKIKFILSEGEGILTQEHKEKLIRLREKLINGFDSMTLNRL